MRAFNPLWFLGSLCVLTVLLFARALHYPMVFDDEIYLVSNPLFKSFENFCAIFSNFNWVAKLASKLGLDGDLSTNFLMRPVTYFSFYLNFKFGGLNPAGYRVVNILVHAANACLVFRLAVLFLESKRLQQVGRPPSFRCIPWLAGLLFACHPLQIESTVYIIQRATALCTFFYLAGVLCHFEANRNPSRLWRLASFLSVGAAMLSKESGVTAPVVAVLLDVVLFGSSAAQALLRARWLLALLPLTPSLLVLVSKAQSGGWDAGSALSIAHGPTGTGAGYPFEYLLTQPLVWVRYLGLLAWPANLNIDPEILAVKNPWEWRLWGPLSILIGAGAASLWMRSRPVTRFAGDLCCLGLGWFALTISPDSSFVPLPDFMAEHRTYLPSVGVSIFVIGALCALPVPRLVHPVAGGVLVVLLSLASVQRLGAWSSPVRLWEDTSAKSPGKPRPLINLTAAYFDNGDLDKAERACIRSIEVAPTVPAFINLLVIYRKKNMPEKALAVAREGLKFRPSGYDHKLLQQMGDLCFSMRLWRDAIEAYKEVLLLYPDLLSTTHLLARCYFELGDNLAAAEVYRAALVYHRGDPALAKALEALETAPPPFRLRLGN